MTVHTWQPGMFERPCGTCSLCCKLPAAPAPLNKPAWQWCKHCRPGKERCTIYDQRPQGCIDFQCLWKVMPDFPEDLRPDRSKVIWQMTEDGTTAIAMTEYPERLRDAQHQKLASCFRAAGIQVVERAING